MGNIGRQLALVSKVSYIHIHISVCLCKVSVCVLPLRTCQLLVNSFEKRFCNYCMLFVDYVYYPRMAIQFISKANYLHTYFC